MRYLVLGACCLLFQISCTQSVKEEVAVNTATTNDFVDSLLSEMTLREKIGQLNQYSVGAEMTGPGQKEGQSKVRYEQLLNGEVGSVLNLLGAENTYKLQKQVVEQSRLGIPLIFSYDVVHGYKTMFPIPLGESASWDLELMERTAQVGAKEAAAAGLQWTFAPMVDITRDARWGRVMEGAGEDPYLGSAIAKSRVKGFQGDDLADPLTIAACAKHFAGYGFVESGADYNNVNISREVLLNVIIPPFKASAEAGAATFMNAFNDVEGVPSTGNEYLLRDLLKNGWGYNGMVVSDWNSIGEMVSHGVAADLKEAAKMAITAGSDMDMEASAYINHLEELVKEGAVEEALINDAVKRVLQLKYDLGLFEDPYRYCDVDREKELLLNAEHKQLAREAARGSIVLLKNENSVLPIANPKSIGVIGPLAKDKDSPLGNWRANADQGSAVSFYEGLMAATDTTAIQVNYAEGCKLSIGPNNFFNEVEIEEEDKSGFAEAISVAKQSELVVMVLGETAYMSGEGRSRADIGLPGLQLELLKAVYEVNPNIVLVLMNGRPLTLTWEAEHIPAIVETWHAGSEAGNGIADVLFGRYNPAGKLPMTFPRMVGQLPMYYNHKNTGRPFSGPNEVFYTHHTDVDKSPLYPFGFGLSYTDFSYGDISLSSNTLSDKGSITATVEVRNTGELEGQEVVQLYLRDLVGSVTRPIKELKGFQKITLKAGESKKVSFEITTEDLAFYRQDYSYGTEPGDYQLFIGTNSEEVKEASFTLK